MKNAAGIIITILLLLCILLVFGCKIRGEKNNLIPILILTNVVICGIIIVVIDRIIKRDKDEKEK